MKVLFTSEYQYVGRVMSKYAFEDKFGDVISVSQAKLVDRENDIVILFFESSGNTENIQYSFATARRLGLDFTNLYVPNIQLSSIQ